MVQELGFCQETGRIEHWFFIGLGRGVTGVFSGQKLICIFLVFAQVHLEYIQGRKITGRVVDTGMI